VLKQPLAATRPGARDPFTVRQAMDTTRSDFVKAVVERGFLHQCTDLEALDREAATAPRTAYIGFDCTAPSLHVGSLVSIMLLRWLQRTGHKPIVLLGGGTTRIGDPSGKDAARALLSDEQIAANMAGIRRVFEKYLAFGDGPTDAIMVDNNEWLDDLKYIEFLREHKGVLDEPYSRHIKGKIRELRVDFARNRHRVFYFVFVKRTIILLHAFLKTTAKTPISEIKKAQERYQDVIKNKQLYE